MKLLITIDTECDNSWKRSRTVTTENARFLPRFQALCEKYGFRPTYLVAYEMAQDEFFVEFAGDTLKRGTCEIGSHPHAWHNPPVEYQLTSDDYKHHPLMTEYPAGVIKEKVGFLTGLLEETFNTRMYSHRAGKWAFSSTYAQILSELGYKVDLSVSPNKKWYAKKRPAQDPICPDIDYRHFPEMPYFLDRQDISRQGDLPVLEIPMTVLPAHSRILRAIHDPLDATYIAKGLRSLFGPPDKWFRPVRGRKILIPVANTILKKNRDYIMFMLHSSELMPGGSPTFKTETDIDHMYTELEEAFQFLVDNHVDAATCYGYYQWFCTKLGGETPPLQ